MRPVRRAIGLMSGTSLDGIDAALIETDGERVHAVGAWATYAYPDPLRNHLKSLLGARHPSDQSRAAERALTLAHAEAVKEVMQQAGLRAAEVDVVGFHGQTLFHAPDERFTWQLGDGELLAEEVGIDVVCDFRSADMVAGGEGAPFAPVYHRALAAGENKPLAILNVGGVSNVTFIGQQGEMLAFDTGPGNAPLDRWVERHSGARFDKDGVLAKSGQVDEGAVQRFLQHGFFATPVPKSLDRMAFDALLDDLTSEMTHRPADGAATLLGCTVAAIQAATRWLPEVPEQWFVTGGGRLNPVLMSGLQRALQVPVSSVDQLGWNGDALEAQCFGFLAVRHLEKLPLSFPGTTGVARPMLGGRLHRT